MKFLKRVIVYHSIESPEFPAVEGSCPISRDRLMAQIEGLKRKGWYPAPIWRLHEDPPRPFVFITADDGTVDWLHNGLRPLDAMGIPTHTALIPGVWEGQWPLAHIVQIALARGKTNLPFVPTMAQEAAILEAEKAYAYEIDPGRRRFKAAVNLVLDERYAGAVLSALAMVADITKRFAHWTDYHGLRRASFGSHGIDHSALDGDAYGYARRQALAAQIEIASKRLPTSNVFTLPMRPRPGADLKALEAELQRVRFTGMFDGAGEWDGESFVIPRIDAKKVEEAFGL